MMIVVDAAEIVNYFLIPSVLFFNLR